MKTKEDYINYANKTFKGKALELVLDNINLYYKENVFIEKNKYSFGEDVSVKKGTFLHGLGGSPDSYNNFKIFDYVCENGFIGGDFNERPTVKILNSVGMWNIRKDQLLKDYIRDYSGVTIKYRVGNREIGLTDYHELCNCDNMENRLKELSNQEEVWQ